MKICYRRKTFNDEHLKLIRDANRVMEDYARQGYELTLRGLYYRLFALDLFPASWADPKTGNKNNIRSYNKLKTIISDGRLAGLIDWDHLVDRLRVVDQNLHFDSPAHRIRTAAQNYARDKWEGQEYRVEVWYEKDAVLGILQPVCNELDVASFVCRGYGSSSSVWQGAMRLLKWARAGYKTRIIYFGDHDPSGTDMTRDVFDRVTLFVRHHLIQDWVRAHAKDAPTPKKEEELEAWYGRVADGVEADGLIPEVDRVALNMSQIEEYNPPPAPAKVTDSRAGKYIEEHGEDCWELDALEPQVLEAVLREAIDRYRDEDLWNEIRDREEEERELIIAAADRWDDITVFLEQK